MQSLRRLASRTSSNIWLHAALSKTGLFRCRCCCCYCHCRSFVFVSPECRRRRRHHISCRRLSMPCPIANELQFYLKEYKWCKTIYSNCQFCRAKIWLNCLCRGSVSNGRFVARWLVSNLWRKLFLCSKFACE